MQHSPLEGKEPDITPVSQISLHGVMPATMGLKAPESFSMLTEQHETRGL